MAIRDYTECMDARSADVRRILANPVDSGDKVVELLPYRGYPLSASDYIDLHYHPEEDSKKLLKFLDSRSS